MCTKIYLFVLFCAIFFSVSGQSNPRLYRETDSVAMTHWVDSIFGTMTVEEKIGQLFMPVADPKASDVNNRKVLELIRQRKIGGLLFSKGSWEDQAKSTNLYQQAARIPLLISLDGEWGLSMRLANTTQFPKNMMVGAISDVHTLELYGAEVARQCREMGIQINFAPVLDVNSNPRNPVIGTRSFGENPQRVIAGGNAYSRGLESGQVMAVAKHFPGHGDTGEDSHHTLPVLSRTKTELEEQELLPFRAYVDSGFSGLMTGHLYVPALDSETSLPASLSPSVVGMWLRDSLQFRGLSFTDALVMKGAATKENACVQALLAGNDILLSPGKPISDFEAVCAAVADSTLSFSLMEEKCKKVLRYKYILGLNRYRPIEISRLDKALHTDTADWLCRKMNAEAMTLVKNANDLLPLKFFERRRIGSLSLGSSGITDFQQMLKRYTKVDAYSLDVNAKAADVAKVMKELADCQIVICGIHSPRYKENEALVNLLKEKKVVCCFFTSPYTLTSYKRWVENAHAIVVAYENTEYAQEYAAQAVMGGIPITGKLPVSVPGLFAEGAGLITPKTRLSYQSPIEAGMSSDTLERIDQLLLEAIRQKAFPGCQMLIAKDGVVVYEKSFGYFDYANTHPVRNNDLYDLASVTKIMATVPAIMKLYDSKKLKLSDKLGDFITQISATDKASITVKDALLHESGLVPFIPFYQQAVDKDSYQGSLFSNKRTATYRVSYDKNVYGRTDFKFLPDLVSKVKKKGFNTEVAQDFYVNDGFRLMILRQIATSNFRVKKTYRYSDLNFMLLKEAAENITGEKFDEFLDANFYERIGANYTMFRPFSQKVAKTNIAPTENDQMIRNQILAGYVHDEAAAFMGGVSGNAGLFSNANDLAKLMQLFLNGGEYGGETYYSQATSDTFLKTKSTISRRGLGFDKPDDKRSPDFVPASTFGHTGYTGTSAWADPDNGLLYILLTNRVYPSRSNTKLTELEVRDKLRQAVYDALKIAPQSLSEKQ